MNYLATTTALTLTSLAVLAAPTQAASLSALNSTVVKFNQNTSEAALIDLGAASISFGETTIYIGTNQVSSNNQDPIVTSFTNGVRNWVQSYDSSNIDGRGVGLLWDEASENLYGVFTADGGSTGPNTFGSTAQGWLPSYGSGGGSKASVLLKLDPEDGEAEAGTYIRSQLSNGKMNTVVPTGLDYVNDQVVFFGDAFFTPLDVDGQPFDNKTSSAGSPFPYRVVLTPDLSEAVSAEAIGWEGVTAFSPLEEDTGDSDDDPEADNDEDVEEPEEDESEEKESEKDDSEEDESEEDEEDPSEPGDDTPDMDDDGDQDDMASVPEPGIVAGLAAFAMVGKLLRRS